MNSASPFRIYVTPSVCRIDPNGPTDAVLSAMQSFPSGHTSESFLVGTFLALYLNAKLKAFSDYHTSFWKMFAIISPLFGSILVAGTLIVDRVRISQSFHAFRLGIIYISPRFYTASPWKRDIQDRFVLCTLTNEICIEPSCSRYPAFDTHRCLHCFTILSLPLRFNI